MRRHPVFPIFYCSESMAGKNLKMDEGIEVVKKGNLPKALR